MLEGLFLVVGWTNHELAVFPEWADNDRTADGPVDVREDRRIRLLSSTVPSIAPSNPSVDDSYTQRDDDRRPRTSPSPYPDITPTPPSFL
jgi:hypothetical protein